MEDTNLINEIVRLVFGVLSVTLTILAGVYVPRVARALEERLGVDIHDPVVAQAERLACDAIAFAEERARARAKLFGATVLGSEKLNMAARYFREHAGDQVLALLQGHVTDWIEAKLGLLRGVPLAPGVTVAQVMPSPATPGPGPSSSRELSIDITMDDTQPAVSAR